MGETGYWRKNKNEVDIILKKDEELNGFEIKSLGRMRIIYIYCFKQYTIR